MPESERRSQETEKPPFFYHASSNRSIEKFVPRAQRIRDPKEGPLVFAASDIAQASVHMIEADDSWSSLGQSNGVPYAIFSNRERFDNLDNGGAVYVLPSDSFSVDQPEEHPSEWTSHEEVIPIEKIEFKSALDAMIDNGVQVFFTDAETLERIRRQVTSDEFPNILNSLVSENSRLGRNARRIPVDE